MNSAWKLVLTSLVAVLVSGCGERKTYPVGGRVVYRDGQPMIAGRVEFERIASEDAIQTVSAVGEIQPDGRFDLTTYERHDGAMPGAYRAIVLPPPPDPSEPEPATPTASGALDVRYTRYETSGLNFVVERRRNDFRIEVERPVTAPNRGG